MDDKKQVVETVASELMEMLQIKGTIACEVIENVYYVKIDTEESGLLIGHHGGALNALQFILANLVYRRTNIWERVIVDVGGYRDKRADSLKAMAREYATRVKETKEPLALPELSSFERRIVHMELTNDADVVTVSEGEGRDRRLIIKPKADSAG